MERKARMTVARFSRGRAAATGPGRFATTAVDSVDMLSPMSGSGNRGTLEPGRCCCNVLSLLCSLREDSRSVVMSQLNLNHYHENASKGLLRARFRQDSSLG